ncbi:MAG: hypothetical protein Fur0025_06690 [Oscillatoriaceae cyanobacterium]
MTGCQLSPRPLVPLRPNDFAQGSGHRLVPLRPNDFAQGSGHRLVPPSPQSPSLPNAGAETR